MSNEIDTVLVETTTSHYTLRRPVLRGSFNLSKASIPYFHAIMPLEEAVEQLKLIETLPSDLRAHWRLEELFQREIDWDRVETEILKGYLRRPEKIQFFNSITVALLPIDETKMLVAEYGETVHAPQVEDHFRRAPWRTIDIGGIQVIKNTSTPHGYLNWDPRRIFPATIDGQHRLAALQEHVRTGNLTVNQLETGISVTFLILDERAGFKVESGHTADDENLILTVVREVFIDLNRTAIAVSRSRQILLDDQEIESRCVRRLLAPRVGEVVEGRLPLGLVHWQHSVSAKFNSGAQTGPFITTSELLYSIVRDLLALERPKDPLDASHVRKFVKSVEEALGVSNLIASNPAKYPGLVPLMSYVDRMYLGEGFERPFANLPGPYLRVCDDGFDARWREPIVGVLTRFKPYKDFIEQVRQRGGIDGDLASYLCLPSRAQKMQAEEWGEQRVKKIDNPLDELAKMKTDDWPFYAVFQKALLRATRLALIHATVVPNLRDLETPEVLEKWIAFLDVCWERGLFKVRSPFGGSTSDMLWAGIALTPGARSVKWSEASVGRIANLLLLWWYLYASELRQVGSFITKACAPRGDESFPTAKSGISGLRKGLKSTITLGVDDLEEAEIDKRVEARLRKILKLGCSEEVTGDVNNDDNNDLDDDSEGQEDGATAAVE